MNITASIKKLLRTIYYVWLLLIVVLTSMPFNPNPENTGKDSFRWDYPEHFFMYFLIPVTFILVNYDIKFFSKKFNFLVLYGLLFAMITEFYQIWIPGRSFNPTDLALNTSGFITGILCSWLIQRFMYRKNFSG